ncbi:MAG: hypothetical protein U9N63_01300 [Pseudomonadota bacterium]|nr:hypothetical protein [Pseudomonadota bacterium]
MKLRLRPHGVRQWLWALTRLIKEGYPAIMITDTAFFRYNAYHTPNDTAEKLDYNRMARVVTGLIHTIMELAER